MTCHRTLAMMARSVVISASHPHQAAGRDGVLAGRVGQAWVMTLGTAPRQRLTLAVACTAQVMMVLDVMIVGVVLPSLRTNSTSRPRAWNGWLVPMPWLWSPRRECPECGTRRSGDPGHRVNRLGGWAGVVQGWSKGCRPDLGRHHGRWRDGCGTTATGTAVRPRRWTAPCRGPRRRPYTKLRTSVFGSYFYQASQGLAI
jgi:hypothetical protein